MGTAASGHIRLARGPPVADVGSGEEHHDAGNAVITAHVEEHSRQARRSNPLQQSIQHRIPEFAGIKPGAGPILGLAQIPQRFGIPFDTFQQAVKPRFCCRIARGQTIGGLSEAVIIRDPVENDCVERNHYPLFGEEIDAIHPGDHLVLVDIAGARPDQGR